MISSNNGTFCPIHYLGNKSRLSDEIVSRLLSEKKGDGAIADLFAGTGVISNAISENIGCVVACDVQYYSQVLTSSLILDYPDPGFQLAKWINEAKANYQKLLEAYALLIEFEKQAFEEARKGTPDSLFSIIECGHLHKNYSENDLQTSSSHQLQEIINSVSLNKKIIDDMITTYFGGIFFSYDQALALDALWLAINGSPSEFHLIGKAALLAVASSIANTVGNQFAQPLNVRTSDGFWKTSILPKVLRDREKDPFDIFVKKVNEINAARHPRDCNRFVREDCLDLLGEDGETFSAIYADPPYSRYHYSRYYHVLETIALHDYPGISLNHSSGKPSKGIYRDRRFQSPFSTKKGALPAFEKLFELSSRKSNVLLLSYSPYPNTSNVTPRMATIDQLKEGALRYFNKVEVIEVIPIHHSKFNKSSSSLETSENAEVLILCKQ